MRTFAPSWCNPTGRSRTGGGIRRRPAAELGCGRTGRPLVSAAVVPGGSGRASGPTRAVTGRRAERFLTSSSVCAIRGLRTSWSGADVSGGRSNYPIDNME
jgi:hypothetical protein